MLIAARTPTARVSQRRALLEPALEAAAQQARQLGLSDEDAVALFRRCLEATSGGDRDDEDGR